MSETRNPWKIINEKNVYDNKWINVTEFNVINPNGGQGIYGKVHFKNIAVGILPLDNELNTYLVGQYRFPLNAYSWEIPEGGGDLKEMPVDSGKRELLEETGLVAKDWSQILTLHLSNSVSDELAIIFLARSLEQRSAIPEETEELMVKKLPFNNVYQMVERNEITDAMSVAAILKVGWMLRDGLIQK